MFTEESVRDVQTIPEAGTGHMAWRGPSWSVALRACAGLLGLSRFALCPAPRPPRSAEEEERVMLADSVRVRWAGTGSSSVVTGLDSALLAGFPTP